MCCNSWGRKESDTTVRLNRTELNICQFFCISCGYIGGHIYLVAQLVKNLPAVQTWVQSLVWKDPLDKEMGTHSSILA